MGEDAVEGSLGEDGREESVISSMSEWEDADLGDFFFPNACLKELRSCGKKQICYYETFNTQLLVVSILFKVYLYELSL